ncbi:putative DNA damage-binding protein 2 isoform X2 [Penaeus vannamei]|uniref:Damage-specific DNA-binding protein 2 n=1 Tax=Penaeus vannamei TaxID=6689 RepID=A0A3R7NYE5_PENVA|nr:putative DNA damage-binding protein 2 isoform X2 [Penaeus vannamei]
MGPRSEKEKLKKQTSQGDSDSDDDFEPKKQFASPSVPSRKKVLPKKKANDNKENLKNGKQKRVDQKAKPVQEEKKEEFFWNENLLRNQKLRGVSYSSCHIVHYLRNITQGTQQFLAGSGRATALAWHPTNPNVVAVGSKGGDIILWNYQADGNKPRTFIKGTGANGSIQALKFNTDNPNLAYTASINGNMECQDVTRGHCHKVFLSTGDCEMPWCFVTASVDRSLKVWDIRNLKSRSSCLYSHIHERPVNSAHFSRTDGGRLLTTDQHSEMRVYSCPSFTLSRTISHPHRQFQHLTPIKATWHPLRDIIVVGRYPDPAFPGYVDNEPRTVDFFDGATGKLLHQHMDKGCDNKIISLNLFNQTGDALLSSAALLVWVWKPKFSCDASKGSLDSEGCSLVAICHHLYCKCNELADKKF